MENRGYRGGVELGWVLSILGAKCDFCVFSKTDSLNDLFENAVFWENLLSTKEHMIFWFYGLIFIGFCPRNKIYKCFLQSTGQM